MLWQGLAQVDCTAIDLADKIAMLTDFLQSILCGAELLSLTPSRFYIILENPQILENWTKLIAFIAIDLADYIALTAPINSMRGGAAFILLFINILICLIANYRLLTSKLY